MTLLSPEEVSRLTGFSRDTIYRALAAGDLAGFKPGRGERARWRVRREDVDRWLRGERVEAPRA
jgi:excisionase family DNA binding protein